MGLVYSVLRLSLLTSLLNTYPIPGKGNFAASLMNQKINCALTTYKKKMSNRLIVTTKAYTS